jgi:hypothetical protein
MVSKSNELEDVAKRIVNNFADLMLPQEERYLELERMICLSIRAYEKRKIEAITVMPHTISGTTTNLVCLTDVLTALNIGD